MIQNIEWKRKRHTPFAHSSPVMGKTHHDAIVQRQFGNISIYSLVSHLFWSWQGVRRFTALSDIPLHYFRPIRLRVRMRVFVYMTNRSFSWWVPQTFCLLLIDLGDGCPQFFSYRIFAPQQTPGFSMSLDFQPPIQAISKWWWTNLP